MSDEQLKEAKSPILHIPTVLVAIVPIYHVPGVKGNLLFSGPVSRYLPRKHQDLDHPHLKDINPAAPAHLDIAVVHRTDGKSNYIFSDFLSKASPKWHSQIGDSSPLACGY